MTILPEYPLASLGIETDAHPNFPVSSFLQRRRQQLVTEIAGLRQQQTQLWSGRYDINFAYSKVWIARFRAQWENRPAEVPALLEAEAKLTAEKDQYRAETLDQTAEIASLICEAEALLQELTLACIAEAESDPA